MAHSKSEEALLEASVKAWLSSPYSKTRLTAGELCFPSAFARVRTEDPQLEAFNADILSKGLPFFQALLTRLCEISTSFPLRTCPYQRGYLDLTALGSALGPEVQRVLAETIPRLRLPELSLKWPQSGDVFEFLPYLKNTGTQKLTFEFEDRRFLDENFLRAIEKEVIENGLTCLLAFNFAGVTKESLRDNNDPLLLAIERIENAILANRRRAFVQRNNPPPQEQRNIPELEMQLDQEQQEEEEQQEEQQQQQEQNQQSGADEESVKLKSSEGLLSYEDFVGSEIANEMRNKNLDPSRFWCECFGGRVDAQGKYTYLKHNLCYVTAEAIVALLPFYSQLRGGLPIHNLPDKFKLAEYEGKRVLVFDENHYSAHRNPFTLRLREQPKAFQPLGNGEQYGLKREIFEKFILDLTDWSNTNPTDEELKEWRDILNKIVKNLKPINKVAAGKLLNDHKDFFTKATRADLFQSLAILEQTGHEGLQRLLDVRQQMDVELRRSFNHLLHASPNWLEFMEPGVLDTLKAVNGLSTRQKKWWIRLLSVPQFIIEPPTPRIDLIDTFHAFKAFIVQCSSITGQADLPPSLELTLNPADVDIARREYLKNIPTFLERYLLIVKSAKQTNPYAEPPYIPLPLDFSIDGAYYALQNGFYHVTPPMALSLRPVKVLAQPAKARRKGRFSAQAAIDAFGCGASTSSPEGAGVFSDSEGMSDSESEASSLERLSITDYAPPGYFTDLDLLKKKLATLDKNDILSELTNEQFMLDCRRYMGMQADSPFAEELLSTGVIRSRDGQKLLIGSLRALLDLADSEQTQEGQVVSSAMNMKLLIFITVLTTHIQKNQILPTVNTIYEKLNWLRDQLRARQPFIPELRDDQFYKDFLLEEQASYIPPNFLIRILKDTLSLAIDEPHLGFTQTFALIFFLKQMKGDQSAYPEVRDQIKGYLKKYGLAFCDSLIAYEENEKRLSHTIFLDFLAKFDALRDENKVSPYQFQLLIRVVASLEKSEDEKKDQENIDALIEYWKTLPLSERDLTEYALTVFNEIDFNSVRNEADSDSSEFQRRIPSLNDFTGFITSRANLFVGIENQEQGAQANNRVSLAAFKRILSEAHQELKVGDYIYTKDKLRLYRYEGEDEFVYIEKFPLTGWFLGAASQVLYGLKAKDFQELTRLTITGTQADTLRYDHQKIFPMTTLQTQSTKEDVRNFFINQFPVCPLIPHELAEKNRIPQDFLKELRSEGELFNSFLFKQEIREIPLLFHPVINLLRKENILRKENSKKSIELDLDKLDAPEIAFKYFDQYYEDIVAIIKPAKLYGFASMVINEINNKFVSISDKLVKAYLNKNLPELKEEYLEDSPGNKIQKVLIKLKPKWIEKFPEVKEPEEVAAASSQASQAEEATPLQNFGLAETFVNDAKRLSVVLQKCQDRWPNEFDHLTGVLLTNSIGHKNCSAGVLSTLLEGILLRCKKERAFPLHLVTTVIATVDNQTLSPKQQGLLIQGIGQALDNGFSMTTKNSYLALVCQIVLSPRENAPRYLELLQAQAGDFPRFFPECMELYLAIPLDQLETTGDAVRSLIASMQHGRRIKI